MSHVRYSSQSSFSPQQEKAVNAAERFPLFQGRTREIERLQPLLEQYVAPRLDPGPVDWRAFLECHYDPWIPFHGPVHVMYGLIWLGRLRAPLDLMLAWLSHDADHTGIRSESPESMHADVAEEEFGHDLFRDGILETAFPYAEMLGDTPLDWLHYPAQTTLGAWLRRTDTLRGFLGGDELYARDIGECSTLSVHLFEILGYPYELNVAGTFESHAAFYQGQVDFFPGQLVEGLRARTFGPYGTLDEQFRLEARVARVGRNWQRMIAKGPAYLDALYEFWLQDVTLPEFVVFARELEAKSKG